jgi:hypothetical protein
MARKKYFKYVPNFDYVSRLPGAQSISDYVQTKNLFKRVKLSEEIFENLTFFTKYKINDEDRPDNVAYKVYDDANLDWLVMLSNNIINYESEWPMDQMSYNNYLLSKYGSYENLYNIHHYETQQILDSNKQVILQKGLIVPVDFSITYYDSATGTEKIANNITDGITNQLYEDRIQDEKSNIYLLKPNYLPVILDEIENLMPYQEGSTQYIGRSLVKGDNIRLYQ